MANAFDFPGGIYPPERKTLSNQQPLVQAPLPHRVVLPLNQHIGAPAEPCVALGQRVRAGERVAIRQGMVSADVHASLTGTVTAIEPRPVPHPSGGRTPCIVIEATQPGDREDPGIRLDPLEWRDCDEATLLARLDRSGIVGMGGAGFPTQVKARVRQHHLIDTLVINAAECEPYITADDLTLRAYPHDVLEGAQLLAHLSGTQRILVGIEDNKPEAIEALKRALRDASSDALPVEIRAIPTRYPSGGERQLIKRLLDREVPGGGLPAEVGVLCHNPGTLLAAIRAVRDGQPMISRVVTLTGEALASPGNVEARLGTCMHELLTFAGLRESRLEQLIMGGPMMGFPLPQTGLPLVKSANCLIAATAEELPAPPAELPCVRCGACEQACPVGLLPQQLYWYSKGGEHDKAERFNLFDCIECGACSYVCSSHIPLVQYFRAAKGEIRAHRDDMRQAEHARHRFEFRQARIAREEAEKLTKRQARARASTSQRMHAVTQESRQDAAVTPHAQSDSAAGQEELKSLRIAQAASKAALRKAEKALARASHSGDSDEALADLEIQLATAREHLAATEARLATLREAATSETQEPLP
ncbi:MULTISPECIES: electron transport complex subunit RsxC [Halomonadaceae]|uniref:electron transport complex subunit RsxC n=1 Tax=Halomonadaceae TaxID=28256 RepID=UPI001599248A|nr:MULTISPECIES: electron transport complex subunit RsxC [Halomonas]QJQ94240.1 electron transport complex subunit RsxC [Halomonas sp. PA5]